MNFSNNLQYLRKKENLSQEQLAEKLDVTRQSVSKWESGQSYPEMDKLIAISKMFNCTIEQLVNGDVSDVNTQQKNNSILNDTFKKISNVIDDIATMLGKKDFKGIIKFIVEIGIIILIIWALKLPFILLQEITEGMLNNFGQPGYYISKVWYYIIEIAYIVSSFLFFIYAFKARFLKKEEIQEAREEIKTETKEENNEKNIPKQEVIVKEKVIGKKDNTLISIVAGIILFFLKAFAFFVLCFVLMAVVFFTGCLAASLIVLLQGVGILGIVIGCLGCVIGVILITEVLTNFIFNKKGSFKRLFITFCVSLVLIGSGIAISAFDFTKFTITEDFPQGYEWVTRTKEFDMTNNLTLNKNMVYEDLEFIVDNDLKNKIKVELVYHKDCRDDVINLDNDTITVEWNINDIKINKIYKSLINGLKNNTIHSFSNIYEIKIKVYGNEKNLQKIQQQYEKTLESENKNHYQEEIDELQKRNKQSDEQYNQIIEQKDQTIMELTDKYENLNTKYEEVNSKYQELLEKIKNLSE